MKKFLNATAAFIIGVAAVTVAFATPAAAGPGVSFESSTKINLGKNSLGHGSAGALNMDKKRNVNFQGATATQIELGKVKANNQAQGSAQFPRSY